MNNASDNNDGWGDDAAEVPEQESTSWAIALSVSWGSLRRRFLRSLVTMVGVILAVAFLTYMLVNDSVTEALVALNDDALNALLQRAGVDIFAVGETDQMMVLLITLSLITCLAGIVNSMLMAVTERIKEIGTLKCLGALDSFIVTTYFIESSIQGIIGTVAGLLIGLFVGLGVLLRSYGGFVLPNLPAAVILGNMAIAFVIGAAMSIGASIIPAYLAARKEPVEAMRVEE